MDNINISFKKLEKIDLELMCRWYNTDSVNEWIGNGQIWTLKQIEDKYLPCISGQGSTENCIIIINNQKIGYIADIRISLLEDEPEYYKHIDEDKNTASLMLFIGESNYIHKGTGSIIIKKFLENIVFKNDLIKKCIADADPSNKIAIKAYEKAGFKHSKTIKIPDDDEYEECYIMEIKKEEL